MTSIPVVITSIHNFNIVVIRFNSRISTSQLQTETDISDCQKSLFGRITAKCVLLHVALRQPAKKHLTAVSALGIGTRFIAVIFEALGSYNEDTRYLGYIGYSLHERHVKMGVSSERDEYFRRHNAVHMSKHEGMEGQACGT